LRLAIKGNIAVEALVDYDKEGDGDYYQLPKKTMTECPIDPYIYPVQGEPTLITSLVVPILVGKTFYGIAGVDMQLGNFQEIVDDVSDLYNGIARIAIISNNGTIAGVTGAPELQGKHMKEIHADWEDDLASIQNGKSQVHDSGNSAATTLLLHLGSGTLNPRSKACPTPRELFRTGIGE